MNDQNSQMVDLERSLRALAEEDCDVQAPPQVQAAVMQTWDILRPFAQHRRGGRRVRVRAARLAIGFMAAAGVAVVVMYRAPSEPSPPEPVARAVEKPPVVTNGPPADSDTPVAARRPRPQRRRTRGETAAPHDEPGMVLVADPLLDASATSIVRVRVPRTALVTLGLPLVDPDDGRSVDLEMLVGEDGVARTIRRAVPVAVRRE